MRGADGRPWINSFAHGLSIYRLRYDARAVRVRIERAEDQIDTFVKLALSAQLDDIEIKQLTDEVARRTGVGVRAIAATLKSAKQEQQGRRSQERRERHLAERSDPRPQLQNPSVDAPWLPEMNVINDVMAIAMRVRRPRRDIDNDIARKRRHLIPNTHAFTSHQEEDDQ
jgi:hypothetical protein